MGKIIGIGATRLHRTRRIVAPASPGYLQDLVWRLPCKDGAAGYPTLTDDIGGANATILSASAEDTYPGGQVFPNADGVNDVFTAGNVAAANITQRLAICIWFREISGPSGLYYFFGKYNRNSGRQFMLYRSGGSYRFIVSSNGSNYSFTGHTTTIITGWDVFLCGVYHYKTNGTSELRLFMNGSDPSVMSLVGSISNGVGPLYTGTAPLALCAVYNGSTYTSFTNMGVKAAEIYDVDPLRIAAWDDGTIPQLRFAAGSGQ